MDEQYNLFVEIVLILVVGLFDALFSWFWLYRKLASGIDTYWVKTRENGWCRAKKDRYGRVKHQVGDTFNDMKVVEVED